MDLKKLNRKQLADLVRANNKIIENCNKQNFDALRASYLLNDRKGKYIEESVIVGRGKNKRTEIRGYVRWMQDFVDEGTGEVFKIERNKHVRTNGNWI